MEYSEGSRTGFADGLDERKRVKGDSPPSQQGFWRKLQDQSCHHLKGGAEADLRGS